MTRQAFEREMERIQDEVMILGSMVESALLKSVELLKLRDLEASRTLIERDESINNRRFAIEHALLVLIATQQPMARDLRLVASMLDIITQLERMGDYAKGIAKINLLIGTEPLVKPIVDLPLMAEKTCDMLHRSLDAFVQRDVAQALQIPEGDDFVDALYNQVNRELMTYILADPRNIEQANYLVWAAHNLERAADRVTNICERVVFTETGTMNEMDVTDID